MEAAKYLRKAAKIMKEKDNQIEWDKYILKLREKHARKIRLMEVLDNMNGRLIIERIKS